MSLARLRKEVAFDRLLARLLVVAPGRWVLKGGLALDFRFGERARTTRDIDLAIAGGRMARRPRCLTCKRPTSATSSPFPSSGQRSSTSSKRVQPSDTASVPSSRVVSLRSTSSTWASTFRRTLVSKCSAGLTSSGSPIYRRSRRRPRARNPDRREAARLHARIRAGGRSEYPGKGPYRPCCDRNIALSPTRPTFARRLTAPSRRDASMASPTQCRRHPPIGVFHSGALRAKLAWMKTSTQDTRLRPSC